jgi:hypothetical protein
MRFLQSLPLCFGCYGARSSQAKPSTSGRPPRTPSWGPGSWRSALVARSDTNRSKWRRQPSPTIQNAYNLVNRSFETGLVEILLRAGEHLLAYSPLGQGYLTANMRAARCRLTREGRCLAAWAATSWAMVRAPFRPMLHTALNQGKWRSPSSPRPPSSTPILSEPRRLPSSRPISTVACSRCPTRCFEQLHLTYPNPCP